MSVDSSRHTPRFEGLHTFLNYAFQLLRFHFHDTIAKPLTLQLRTDLHGSRLP